MASSLGRDPPASHCVLQLASGEAGDGDWCTASSRSSHRQVAWPDAYKGFMPLHVSALRTSLPLCACLWHMYCRR